MALYQALAGLQGQLKLNEIPLFDSLAAVSVGVVDGAVLVDLDYEEDVAADIDMNVVVAGDDRLVEVQATAEGEPFARAVLDELLDGALAGVAEIRRAQEAAVAGLGER